MKKKSRGGNACWIATETRRGWRVKLSTDYRDFPLSGLLLDSCKDVKQLRGLSVVFVYLDGSEYRP
jgi:hypothetical protein